MRRLWAYIILAFTSLVLVGVSIAPLLKDKVNSNIDYQPGRELVFRVYEKDVADAVELTKDGLDDVATTMGKRLEQQGVSRYEINVQGEDTISVKLSQDYEQGYSNIITYMEFDGSFGLTNSAGDFAKADEFLTSSKARLDTYNNYPCVVLPVDVDNDQYKNVFANAKGENAKAETISEATDEKDAETAYFLYLWYGFDEEEYQKPDVDYNDERILMKFRIADDEKDQYFGKSDNQLYSIINLDTNGDQQVTFSEKEEAYNRAKFFVNLLNASELDYNVKLIGSNYIDSFIEDVVYRGDVSYINFNATVIATIVAIALVSLLLVYWFKVGAIAVIVTTIVSLFAGLAAMVLLNAEYNSIAIFGFIAVAFAALASGIIYLNKIKDEAYRGRSLKKANLEGGKKALLPVVDVNVVLILIGAFSYILGGSVMRTFAAITVLGGLASLVLSTLGLKLLLWLPTNATCMVGKYKAFGIDGDKVPNLINEEKQTYFGPFAERDLTKTKTKMGIFGGVLVVASLACMIVFASLKGSIYAPIKKADTSKVYFETTATEHSQIDESSIRDILAHTFTYEDKNGNGQYDEGEKATSLGGKNITKIDSKDKSYVTKINDEEKTHTVHIVDLAKLANIEGPAYFEYQYIDGSETKTEIIDSDGTDNDVNSILNYVIDAKSILEQDASISVKTVSLHKVGQPRVMPIMLGTLVGVLVSGLYLVLRYRLSRGLAATILALGSGIVGLGLLSICYFIPVSTVAAVLCPLSAFVASVLAIMFMNRERELIIDDKTKDNSLENRKALSVKATSYSYTAVYTYAWLIGFGAIPFFGIGNPILARIYLALTILICLILIINPIVIAPISNSIYRFTRNIQIRKPKAKKKNKKVRKTKSAEPEEAIFIGIND